MKSSHFTTPRTMSEAHFDCRGQALHGFHKQSGSWFDWALVAGFVGLLAAIAVGSL